MKKGEALLSVAVRSDVNSSNSDTSVFSTSISSLGGTCWVINYTASCHTTSNMSCFVGYRKIDG